MPWSQQGWAKQVLLARLAKYFPIISHLNTEIVDRLTVGLFSAFMVTFPISVFFQYLVSGILLISPPLFLMFLAGIVGMGLATQPLKGEATESD